MKKTSYRLLAQSARAARKHAHAPFSGFRVGAALLGADGKVYAGCNIENSSYGLTICAERTALFKAVSQGARKFTAIAIVSDDAGFTPPCGACRQVMMDLAGDIDVVMADRRGRLLVRKASDLLPFPFTAEGLRRFQKGRR
jgi:cytidine deaminase